MPSTNARSLALAGLSAAVLLAAVSPATADYRLERQLTLEPGGQLVVDVESASVDVRGTDSSGARIVVTSRDDDLEKKFALSFDESPGRVTVRADRVGSPARRWFDWSSGNFHFEIEVPRSTEVRVETSGGAIGARSLVGNASLDTSGGSIHVEDVAGRVDAETSGGAIVARQIDGDLSLDTSGGSIEAEGVEGDLVASTSGGRIRIERVVGSVEASTSGGSISVRQVGGRIQARSSGGPVTAEFAAGNAAGGSLSTSGGSVTAYVDPGVGLDIDASSSGGSVTVDMPITVQGTMSKSSIRGSLNGGGPTLILRSSGGGVRVKSL